MELISLTLFKSMSRLNRNGKRRLLSERWLPMLEFISSLLGSVEVVVLGGAEIVTTAIVGSLLSIAIEVSQLSATFEISGGSCDMFQRLFDHKATKKDFKISFPYQKERK